MMPIVLSWRLPRFSAAWGIILVLGWGFSQGYAQMTDTGTPTANKQLPLPGDVFMVEGRTAFLIASTKRPKATPAPWVWYAPTLPGLPGQHELWMFERLVAEGVAIAGIDVGESYGSPEGRRFYAALYRELVDNRGLSQQPCLLARSRGGLMLYNWAAENPAAVAGIAGIYPVCDIRSYPGLNKACGAYGMSAEQLAAVIDEHNPVARLASLAKAGVKIFHLHGDSDHLVPLNRNSAAVAKHHAALGGAMRLKLVEGGGHDVSPHWFQSQPLVEFMIAAAKGENVVFETGENLDGARGNIFRVDRGNRTFELLKETAFDPRTNEGKSRHTVRWTDRTRFVKVVRQNSFEGLVGNFVARIRPFNDNDVAAAAAGRDFVTLNVTLLAADEDGADLKTDRQNLVLPFKPDPTSEKFRGGTVRIDGKPVGVRLRGPRAKVDIRTLADAGEITRGFWGATIKGYRSDAGFIADDMEIYPREDPRATDDPNLPRILVVGDSISMNYHRAAKEALQGLANYYRIDTNGGPSDRGVVCMELWLGDYTQPGLHWDVIQFNHGLHDLKQVYDEETGEYGAYQVPIDEYKANLEKGIRIMKKTGAKLVWCPTTPVPNNSHGRWSTGTFGRRKDADLLYNQAALEVIEKYPEIEINDINRFIRESDAFEKWWQQADVHFWDRNLQDVVGQGIADGLKKVLQK